MSSAARRRALKESSRCPDCTSRVRLAPSATPGVEFDVRVEHDLTCPWLRRNAGANGRLRVLRVVLPEQRDDS